MERSDARSDQVSMDQPLRAQVRIYRPNQRHELGWFQTWVVMARNMVDSKELIWQLFMRDFFASYKKSFFFYRSA